MLKSKSIGVVALLAIVILASVPASAAIFSKSEDWDKVKAEKMVELAETAGQKLGDLIDFIQANDTAMEAITDTGLMDAFNANVTLYNEGLENVTNAKEALINEEYDLAIGNATYALSTFREAWKSIHTILEQSGVEKGQLLEAQGLIQAMQRALERIEKLRSLLPDDSQGQEILNGAEEYLNIDTAIEWLQEGNVSDVAHNLTQANKIIAEAHKYLKEKAEEMNTIRIRNYLRGAQQTTEKIMERLELANKKGLNITAILEEMGYENKDAFKQHLEDLIADASTKTQEIKNALGDLKEIGDTLRELDRSLTELMKSNGQGNKGGKP